VRIINVTRSTKLKSLAKINLDLRILNRRADGFHELRTVFQTVSLADTIEIAFEPARKTKLEIEDALDIPDNLVLRAAEAVLDAMKVHGRVRFRLRKQIPMGAGMGGGSSNAAAVLLALPVLAGKKIAYEKLLALGAALGSDVPFFLTGGTAVAVDRGTEFYSLADIKEEPILVVASGLHVATGLAYQALKRPLNRGLTLPDSSRNINDFQLFARALGDSCSARAASAFSANDFEPVVFSQYPQLQALFHRLQRAASSASSAGRNSARRKAGMPRKAEGEGVRMTGSGSALFALFRSAAERDLAEKSLGRDREFQRSRVIPAKLVSRSSYQRLWYKQLAPHLTAEKTWPPPSRYAQ
jgi:4-diphosphocytidyl-2-C-methyl-D-erythritol kinase